MKKILFITAFLSCVVALSGQELIISGRVTDDKTTAPLAFATVMIKSGSTGTVSNADGEFRFVANGVNSQDTLLVTMMGYASYLRKVSDLPRLTSLQVMLAPRPIQLAEVIVSDKTISAKDIVAKAFRNADRNFQNTPYKLTGFYRELYTENDRAVMLTEVALDVYDQGYGTRTPEKVDVKSIRASRNYRHPCFRKTVVERYNLVTSALRNNPVKYRNTNRKGKSFVIDSVVYLNGRTVYVVSYFTYIPKFPLFERKNTLHVDAETYAIYKYGWEEYATKGKYSERMWRLTKDSPYLSARRRISTIYEYGSYHGRMYLKYFDEKCADDILNAGDSTVVTEAVAEVTWIITGINTDKFDPNAPETLRRDQSLAMQAKPYDASFWSNYREVKLVPLTARSRKELEREVSLEEQFTHPSLP